MEQPVEQDRGKISASLVVGLILAVVVLIFVLSNLGSKSVNFMWLHFEFPAFILFALMVLVGVVLDRAFQWWWPRRKAKRAGTA